MIAPPVSAGDHFIFYGLLKQASVGMPQGLDLERHGEFLGPCRFRGRMFNLGEYPGVVRRGGISHGVLYRLDHPRIARKLDAFEDVRPSDPAGSLYRRERVSVMDDYDRGYLKAWIYVYNQPVHGRPAVKSGSWPVRTASAR